MIAVCKTAQLGHIVDVVDVPAGSGLLEPAADPVLASALDLAAADHSPFGQSLGVGQATSLMRSEVSLQFCQTAALGRANRNRLRFGDQSLDAGGDGFPFVGVCAQTGLAGSSVIGNNVILAGQAGVAGHCSLGDGVILTAQSAVSHDIPPGKMISGSPGFDNRVWLRAVTIFQRLPELLKRLDRVEKKLAAQESSSTQPKGDGDGA